MTTTPQTGPSVADLERAAEVTAAWYDPGGACTLGSARAAEYEARLQAEFQAANPEADALLDAAAAAWEAEYEAACEMRDEIEAAEAAELEAGLEL